MAIDVSKLPPVAQDLLARFPEFQAKSFNDSGANGYVLLGRHNVLQRDVAVKIYFHEPNAIDQEPALLAAINHENVMRVLDARRLQADCSFFMTPYANYGDLAEYLRNYTVGLPLSLRLLCQLLSGLAALHSEPARLVHRDIKPQNLLVHDDRLLIADFGSVRRVSDETGKATASRNSVLYRPIEAFGDGGYFGFASDCYQAGIVGYLLIGGKLDDQNLLSHLKAPELKALDELKYANSPDWKISDFVDSCIRSRVEKGSLLDWDSVPRFVPRKLIRSLKRAVSSNQRFANVSEFLGELASAVSPLPDWIADSLDSWTLRGWKGRDYRLTSLQGQVIVHKRKAGNEKFLKDNALSGKSLSEALSALSKTIGLP